MENHGGKKTVKNIKGGGVCFTFFLPVNPADKMGIDLGNPASTP